MYSLFNALFTLATNVVQLDLVCRLLQLVETDDVCCETWDVIHPGECLVAAVLALDQDRSMAFNVGHRSISKTNGAMNSEINLRERRAHTRHVVGRP
jgi:hypothetical protein